MLVRGLCKPFRTVWVLGAVALLGAAGCSSEDPAGLAADYCDYMRQAPEMSFQEQQQAITELDQRLMDQGYRLGRMRAAIQRECPRVVAEHDVELMGILGDSLGEMREDLQRMQR